MDDREQFIENIEKEISSLPRGRQEALCWLIMNADTIDVMTQGMRLTDGDLTHILAEAQANCDYYMEILVQYLQYGRAQRQGR